MIKYTFGTHKHGESGKIYPTLKVDSPFEKLGIISGLDDLVELDSFIEWLEEMIGRNVPDYIEGGFIIYQPFLWGSKTSKIAEISFDRKFIAHQEFDTNEFLKLCYQWRDFIKQNI